jgi:predicted small integral membrane protein
MGALWVGVWVTRRRGRSPRSVLSPQGSRGGDRLRRFLSGMAKIVINCALLGLNVKGLCFAFGISLPIVYLFSRKSQNALKLEIHEDQANSYHIPADSEPVA